MIERNRKSRKIDFGTIIRPTPTSRGGKPEKLKHTHPADDKEGFKQEQNFVHCKNCGFICTKGRDNICPYCGTENYWKLTR